MRIGNIDVDFSFSNTTNLRKLENAYKKVIEQSDEKNLKLKTLLKKLI